MQASELSKAANFAGFVDAVEDGVVYGWAWNPEAPEEVVDVEILHDGVLVQRVGANQYRPDLVDISIGDGSHAFECNLPDELLTANVAELEIVFADSRLPLARFSPKAPRLESRLLVPRTESEVIRALETRITSQEAVIGDLSTMLQVLTQYVQSDSRDPARNPETDAEAKPDLAEILENQGKTLAAMEVYLTSFGERLRDISEKQDEQPNSAPARGLSSVSTNYGFAAVIIALTVIFGGFFIFVS